MWGKKHLFSCWTQQVILSSQDSTVLPTHADNHNTLFSPTFLVLLMFLLLCLQIFYSDAESALL